MNNTLFQSLIRATLSLLVVSLSLSLLVVHSKYEQSQSAYERLKRSVAHKPAVPSTANTFAAADAAGGVTQEITLDVASVVAESAPASWLNLNPDAVAGVLQQAEKPPAKTVQSSRQPAQQTRTVYQTVCQNGVCRQIAVSVPVQPVRSAGRKRKQPVRTPPVGGFTVGTVPRAVADQTLSTARLFLGEQGQATFRLTRSSEMTQVPLDGGVVLNVPSDVGVTYRFSGNRLTAKFGDKRPAIVMGSSLAVPIHEFSIDTNQATVGLSWCPDLHFEVK